MAWVMELILRRTGYEKKLTKAGFTYEELDICTNKLGKHSLLMLVLVLFNVSDKRTKLMKVADLNCYPPRNALQFNISSF